MDFLDPQKEKAHKVRLLVGYVFLACTVVVATVILLYLAYGFGLKNGKVIQNGFVYLSSIPNPAKVYINGKLDNNQTNARLSLEAGQYTIQLQRDGYRDWKRAVSVEGSSVEHFDYAFLVPNTLHTTVAKNYDTAPALTTQSPDRRWLLMQNSSDIGKFELDDFKDPKNVVTSSINVPDSVLTKGDAGDAESWKLVEWSTDNRHVLLRHSFQKGGAATSEYILVDRQDPTQTANMTTAWGVNPTDVELVNRSYNTYYLYDKAAGTLKKATIKNPTPTAYLDHVLAFKSYGDNMMLYATDQDAPAGMVTVKLLNGDKKFTIRNLSADGTQLLDLTKYAGDWYVVAGSSSEGKAYVYKNPEQTINDNQVAIPAQVLKVAGANYISFSADARFIVAENGNDFAVYDAENDKGYTYTLPGFPLDAPQEHATWMDGAHLTMTSNGKALIFDFDGANKQTLTANNANYQVTFDRNYKYLLTINQAKTTDGSVKFTLSTTPLRTDKDL